MSDKLFPDDISCETRDSGQKQREPIGRRRTGSQSKEKVSVAEVDVQVPEHAIHKTPDEVKSKTSPVDDMVCPGPVVCLHEELDADNEHR